MSELEREITSTRAALDTALRIGETLQARIDAAIAELELEERQLTDAELARALAGS